jgi:hypothetical protein
MERRLKSAMKSRAAGNPFFFHVGEEFFHEIAKPYRIVRESAPMKFHRGSTVTLLHLVLRM